MSITSSISELISSFVSIIQGILASFYHAIETVFATASSLLSSIADLMSGFVRFMLGELKSPCFPPPSFPLLP